MYATAMRKRFPVVLALLTAAAAMLGPDVAGSSALAAGRWESTAGKLLVAAPSMPDGRFAHTVIYMVQHDETGAMGVVINRVIGEGKAGDLLKGLDMDPTGARGQVRINYGGPVEPGRGLVLHTKDYVGEHSIVVNGGLALTASGKILQAIAHGRGPRHSLILFGYAGWGPGQLESELARKDWIVIPADRKLIFDKSLDGETKWEKAVAMQRIEL